MRGVMIRLAIPWRVSQPCPIVFHRSFSYLQHDFPLNRTGKNRKVALPFDPTKLPPRTTPRATKTAHIKPASSSPSSSLTPSSDTSTPTSDVLAKLVYSRDLRKRKAPRVLTPRDGAMTAIIDRSKLPFTIHRTHTGSLPVYTDVKNGRTRVLTVVRSHTGDAATLAKVLQAVCGIRTQVKIRLGRIEIRGNYRQIVTEYLEKCGF